jgi:hypothetical protein
MFDKIRRYDVGDLVEAHYEDEPEHMYTGTIVAIDKGCVEIQDDKGKYIPIYIGLEKGRIQKLDDPLYIKQIRNPELLESKERDEIASFVKNIKSIQAASPKKSAKNRFSKRQLVDRIVSENPKAANKELIEMIVSQGKMSVAGARTYLYNARKNGTK